MHIKEHSGPALIMLHNPVIQHVSVIAYFWECMKLPTPLFFAVATSPSTAHTSLIWIPMLTLTPPYRQSKQFHPHEAHQAAFQRALLFLPFNNQRQSVLPETGNCFSSQQGCFQEASWISFPNICWEAAWWPDRELFASQETHAHGLKCICTPTKTLTSCSRPAP